MKAQASTIRLILIILLVPILAGCGVLGQSTPTPLPTVVLDGASGTSAPAPSALTGEGVTASGVVAPAAEARLAFAVSGIVENVNVAAGDSIETGQVLVRLAGSEKLAAAVEAANLELLAAQQELLNAQKARADLDANLPQAQTDALQALNDARQAVKDAERKVAGITTQASQADLDEAQAALILTEDKLERARKDYREVENDNQNNLGRAAALNRLAQAQRDYDNALRRYNNLAGGSTEFYRDQTMAEMDIARARLEQAQKDYDILVNGPRPDDIAVAVKRIETAQGRIAAAEAAIKSAQADLVHLELKAPSAGTVTEINIHNGEWAIPGQAILMLADLDHLQIETTDLSERDIPSIKNGQAVTVLVKALQLDVPGHVVFIAPLADTIGGDVVYRTTIELDSIPDGLRAGMSVEVQYTP